MRPVGAYVLAGGKSSRMGSDKALVRLGGIPLIERAVQTLRAVCAEASILSSNEALRVYGPLVRDLHEGCGPIGGIEAALEHSTSDWNLLLPVDLPLIPASFLRDWLARVTAREDVHAAYCEVAGRPQPGLLLIRRTARGAITALIERGEYKLLPAIHTAAGERGVWVERIEVGEALEWFANLNTPDELEAAERIFRNHRVRRSDAS